MAVEEVATDSSLRDSVEDSIVEAGLFIPMMYRAAAARAGAADASTLLVVRTPAGRCLGGLAISRRSTPLAPGHYVARIERLGGSLAPDAVAPAIAAAVEFVRRHPRILRLNAEMLSRDGLRREALGRALQQAGFMKAAEPNCYASTLAVDLTPETDAVFASFERSARRNIRATARHPVVVRVIDDIALADRIDGLVRAALARTGGVAPVRDWAAIIAFSLANPSLSRLVGFFRSDETGPDALVAFAWGRSHGDHVEYADSGSVRPPDLRVALSYALVWDLMLWAKGIGASWFDLGGVTRGTLDDATDRLGGISDFKRFFSSQVVDVGEEWVFTPRTARARAARAVHAILARHRDRAQPGPASAGAITFGPVTAYSPPRAGALTAPRGDVARELQRLDLHASGSDALYSVFRAATTSSSGSGAVRPMVWIPAYHCGVEAQAAIDAGCDVGFYRVDDGLRADVDDLAACLARRPGSVLLIHYFGFAQPDGDRIAALCETAGVSLIDDCAHALFTPIGRRDGPRTGTTVFSLQKCLGVFDGGAVCHGNGATGDGRRHRGTRRTVPNVHPYLVAAKTVARTVLGERVTDAVRRYRDRVGHVASDGSLAEAQRPLPARRQYGRGMSALSRALAGAEDRGTVSARRRENYELLQSDLSGCPGFVPVFPALPPDCVPLVLPIRVGARAMVVAKLQRAGVTPYVFGECPHPLLPPRRFPEANRLAAQVVGLPVHQRLEPAQVLQMARIILPILADDGATAAAQSLR